MANRYISIPQELNDKLKEEENASRLIAELLENYYNKTEINEVTKEELQEIIRKEQLKQEYEQKLTPNIILAKSDLLKRAEENLKIIMTKEEKELKEQDEWDRLTRRQKYEREGKLDLMRAIHVDAWKKKKLDFKLFDVYWDLFLDDKILNLKEFLEMKVVIPEYENNKKQD